MCDNDDKVLTLSLAKRGFSLIAEWTLASTTSTDSTKNDAIADILANSEEYEIEIPFDLLVNGADYTF